jgi:hypothetical protein
MRAFKSVSFLLICLITLFTQVGYGQKRYQKQHQVWEQTQLNIKTTHQYFFLFDGGYRTHNWFNDKNKWYLRGLAGREINNVKVGLGYGHFVALGSDFNIPEERLFQRIETSLKIGKSSLVNRYLLEERFFKNSNKTGLKDGHYFQGREM